MTLTEYYVTGKDNTIRATASLINPSHVQVLVSTDDSCAACDLDHNGVKELMVALESALHDAEAIAAQEDWDNKRNWHSRNGNTGGPPHA